MPKFMETFKNTVTFGAAELRLTKDDIIHYLELLNEELCLKDIVGELSMVGGAVMSLCYDARLVTKDIDAIFEPKMIIYECAKIIAHKYNLPEDWLNDGVKGFLSENAKFNKYLELSNLRVHVASPEYMLALKCLSSRLDNLDELEDIKTLIKILGLKSLEQVCDVITKFYPIQRFLPKTQYAIMEILDE